MTTLSAPVPHLQTHSSPVQGTVPVSNASLYVGDLDSTVTEPQLFDTFSQIGPIASVRVCRDLVKRVSLGYGYVNFLNSHDAVRAFEEMNFTHINGKPVRLMFSHRDPSIRKSGYANVYIKNLGNEIDHKSLLEIFSSYGKVLSCKVATDSNGKSKGFGYVQFDKEESAQKSIEQLNGMLVNQKKVYVGYHVRRQQRDQENGKPRFTNVYVKNLPETFSDGDLRKEFEEFGKITSTKVMVDADGNSKGFGFVSFEEPGDAANAVEKMNGKSLNGHALYVGKAQKKVEREAELKAKFEQEKNKRLEKLKAANLYLKNLDESINDEKLKELFSPFGEILSCKVMVDPQGQSRGSGFVQYKSPEEANRAVSELNGKMIGKKPIYVAVAQRKEDRRIKLQAHFSHINAARGMTSPMTSVSNYQTNPPRFASQPFSFAQGANGLIPAQPAGFGFQQQLVRPGVAPNFMMPYHLQRQGQPGQRVGPRRGGMMHPIQQQLMEPSANQGFRYVPSARNNVDMMSQGVMGQMMPVPFDMSNMMASPTDVVQSPPMPVSALGSALASATPERQRVMLGEHLYPLVHRIEQEQASKITGMLLEMDQSEVLHLLDSPAALQTKVAEAMDVLRSSQND